MNADRQELLHIADVNRKSSERWKKRWYDHARNARLRLWCLHMALLTNRMAVEQEKEANNWLEVL